MEHAQTERLRRELRAVVARIDDPEAVAQVQALADEFQNLTAARVRVLTTEGTPRPYSWAVPIPRGGCRNGRRRGVCNGRSLLAVLRCHGAARGAGRDRAVPLRGIHPLEDVRRDLLGRELGAIGVKRHNLELSNVELQR